MQQSCLRAGSARPRLHTSSARKLEQKQLHARPHKACAPHPCVQLQCVAQAGPVHALNNVRLRVAEYGPPQAVPADKRRFAHEDGSA